MGEELPRIDAELVRRLVAAQFPGWAGLPVEECRPQGHDNRSFRLGGDMVVRLPSAGRYAAQVADEARWLPVLAGRLPVPVPEVLETGAPGEGYPFPWSVRRWLEGTPVRPAAAGPELAAGLARFLRQLQAIPAAEAPPPGPRNFHRGGDLAVYGAEMRAAAERLPGRIDAAAVLAIWEQAVGSDWQNAPVWVHGDMAPDNLLADGAGRLAAVLDFGQLGAGDPACDLVAAWTVFGGAARAAFRMSLGYDPDTWDRARGWALWKAAITLADPPDANRAAGAERVIGELLAEAAAD